MFRTLDWCGELSRRKLIAQRRLPPPPPPKQRPKTPPSDVATRLEFVFPSVIRASFVLFSVYYTFSVLAYAMYCSTPLGEEPIGSLKDASMVKR